MRRRRGLTCSEASSLPGIDADYEVALTLQALARTRLRGPKAKEESRGILERLGVLSTPLVPLP